WATAGREAAARAAVTVSAAITMFFMVITSVRQGGGTVGIAPRDPHEHAVAHGLLAAGDVVALGEQPVERVVLAGPERHHHRTDGRPDDRVVVHVVDPALGDAVAAEAVVDHVLVLVDVSRADVHEAMESRDLVYAAHRRAEPRAHLVPAHAVARRQLQV